LGEGPEDKVTRELNNRFLERTEIRPNRVVFHGMEEMRHLLGVGTQLKEQKVIDRRPRKSAQESAVTAATAAGLAPVANPNSLISNQPHVEVKS
jgi:hypothetical protein